MDAGFLNDLTHAYVNALLLGFATLHPWAIRILGLLGSLALMAALMPMITSHDIGGIFAVLVLMLFYMAIMVWLSMNLQDLAMGFFLWFTELGASVSGGAFTAAQFLAPSSIFEMGFTAAWPIVRLIKDMGLIAATLNFGTTLLYFGAVVIILAAFIYAVKDIIMTIIMFHLALMALPILIPWGLLHWTSFLMDFGVSWIFSTCLRMFLTTAVLGLAVPLFPGVVVLLTPGGDAALYSAWVMAATAFVFACLVHAVSGRAAGVSVRGLALAVSGSAISSPALRGAQLAIRGVSRMIQGRRERHA